MNEERKALRMGRHESTLSDGKFYMLFGGILLYGFLINAIFAVSFTRVFLEMNLTALCFGYLILGIIGVCMSKFGGALVSFIGYNFVVIPSGALISVCLIDYSQQDIFAALFIVAIDALVMLLVAMKFPDKMINLGFPLFISLSVGIALEVICLLFGISSGLFDFFFVIVFTGYLGYDFSVVAMYDKTVDNAVDSALDLYLDIINLFLRILSIMGNSKGGKRK